MKQADFILILQAGTEEQIKNKFAQARIVWITDALHFLLQLLGRSFYSQLLWLLVIFTGLNWQNFGVRLDLVILEVNINDSVILWYSSSPSASLWCRLCRHLFLLGVLLTAFTLGSGDQLHVSSIASSVLSAVLGWSIVLHMSTGHLLDCSPLLCLSVFK